MAMDAAYQPLYRQVLDMEFAVKDALDQPNDAAARSLVNELKRLEDEFEMHKSPRSLEDRAESVYRLLWQARSHEDSYMSVDDADAFCRQLEHLRDSLRRLPNY